MQHILHVTKTTRPRGSVKSDWSVAARKLMNGDASNVAYINIRKPTGKYMYHLLTRRFRILSTQYIYMLFTSLQSTCYGLDWSGFDHRWGKRFSRHHTCVCPGVGVFIRVRACSLAYPACNSCAPYCDVIGVFSDSTKYFDIIS